jgi:hypothetical protein
MGYDDGNDDDDDDDDVPILVSWGRCLMAGGHKSGTSVMQIARTHAHEDCFFWLDFPVVEVP